MKAAGGWRRGERWARWPAGGLADCCAAKRRRVISPRRRSAFVSRRRRRNRRDRRRRPHLRPVALFLVGSAAEEIDVIAAYAPRYISPTRRVARLHAGQALSSRHGIKMLAGLMIRGRSCHRAAT